MNQPNEARAKRIAELAHSGQTRWNGDPYIFHPTRVVSTAEGEKEGKREDVRIVAWLHDVVEDSAWTLQDLGDEGFSQEIIASIDALTKRQGESYLNFILRAKKDRIATIVKIADIKDNLRDFDEENPFVEKKWHLKEKYLLALWILEN